MPKIIPALSLVFVVLLFGCSQTESGSSVDPKASAPVISSFADGVTKLASIKDEVKAAFDGGNPHDCDGAIHTAAEILQVLPNTAMDEGKLDAEAMDTVNSASKQLFDQYMKLHHGFHGDHGGEETGYDSVAEAIDEAMSQLQSVSGS